LTTKTNQKQYFKNKIGEVMSLLLCRDLEGKFAYRESAKRSYKAQLIPPISGA
jgi:hypothetical protein